MNLKPFVPNQKTTTYRRPSRTSIQPSRHSNLSSCSGPVSLLPMPILPIPVLPVLPDDPPIARWRPSESQNRHSRRENLPWRASPPPPPPPPPPRGGDPLRPPPERRLNAERVRLMCRVQEPLKVLPPVLPSPSSAATASSGTAATATPITAGCDITPPSRPK